METSAILYLPFLKHPFVLQFSSTSEVTEEGLSKDRTVLPYNVLLSRNRKVPNEWWKSFIKIFLSLPIIPHVVHNQRLLANTNKDGEFQQAQTTWLAVEPDWERDAEISLSPIPKITVKHIGDTTPAELLMKSQYIKNLRKLLPTLVLWLLTEVGKHTCINSRSHGCGAAHLLWGRNVVLLCPHLLKNVCSVKHTAYSPVGIWQESRWFHSLLCQRRDSVSSRDHQILSLCRPSQGMRSLFLWVKTTRLLQWKWHSNN